MVPRLAAAGALLAILTAVAASLLRGGGDYAVTMRVADAGQVIKGNEVRLGAVPIGTVARIGLADDGLAELRLEIDDDHAPLPRGTVARIRTDSLSGVANRAIVLDLPRPDDRRARTTIPDGGVIPATDTQAPVDLDGVLTSLDAPTREGLRGFIRGGAQQIDGRAPEAKLALDRLSPALAGLTAFSDAFTADEDALLGLLREGADATRVLASRGEDLTSLVDRARAATTALADEQESLGDAVRRFPGVLQRGTRTFAGLRTTLDALDPLVADTARVTDTLPAFLGDLTTLARRGATPVTRLADTLAAPGEADDAVDLLADAPKLAARARTAFPRAIRTMDSSRTQVTSLREYTPDVVAALSAAGRVTANYDANGHYARLQPSLLAFDLDEATNTLGPRGGGDPLARLLTGAAAAIRCPGAALEGLADGSAPKAVASCLLTPEATR